MEELWRHPRDLFVTITIGAFEIQLLPNCNINVRLDSLDWRQVLQSGWEIVRMGSEAAHGLIRGKHGLDALKVLGLGISAGISVGILLRMIREFQEKGTKAEFEHMLYEARRLHDQENKLEELTQKLKGLELKIENMPYEAKKADSMSPVDFIEPTNKELQNTQPGDNFTQAELLRIAKDILSEWDLIALRTGLFDHDEITNIRQNISYTDDVRKAMVMLDAYQKRNGTRECLVLALEESQRHDTAGKVRSKYYQNIKPN